MKEQVIIGRQEEIGRLNKYAQTLLSTKNFGRLIN